MSVDPVSAYRPPERDDEVPSVKPTPGRFLVRAERIAATLLLIYATAHAALAFVWAMFGGSASGLTWLEISATSLAGFGLLRDGLRWRGPVLWLLGGWLLFRLFRIQQFLNVPIGLDLWIASLFVVAQLTPAPIGALLLGSGRRGPVWVWVTAYAICLLATLAILTSTFWLAPLT